MLRKILIVDDLSINRRILNGMLSRDYEILEAASGEEALAILRDGYASISAVLLDISMPGIDGFTVLKQVRSDAALSQMPVIMITGSEDEASRVKSLSLGANDYVMKPYSAEIIRHCLRNNIALREAAATVNILERDRLTGVWNREAFFQRAAQEIEDKPAGYFILSCADIESFKTINDQYGSDAGDRVLKVLGGELQRACNEHGGLCGHIFADCFVGLYHMQLAQTDLIGPELLEQRLLSQTGIAVTLSVGRYVVSDKSLSVNAMYDRASIAKSTVKGRYDTHVAIYDERMRDQIVREQKIVNEMNAALANNQFEVWFQPQYNHSTGACIGAEALVRWRHPERSMIPPGDFIHIFEKNGFIYALDKFVWESVCRCLRRWLDEGRSPLPVSVNISRYDALRPDVVEVLTGLIEKYNLPLTLLRLEITESAFSESSQHIVEVVKRLIGCGFTVEIDDFGSGYSSLNTLKDVPAQILKLDMQFLESGDGSERGGNIVESIVRMAKWLGMSVIAEGVETLEQANYLRSIGCNYMQGYLYAHPMPVDQYEAHCSKSGKEEHLLTLETVEHLDNNAFWDPESMDTLIFNSYIGAACIYEYHNGKIELLRATEKYAQVIGSAGMTVEDALKLNWAEHLNAENIRRIVEDLEESIATKSEITGEYVFLDLPNCPHETYLRSTMRVIASAGERYLVYCTNENITAQRQSERAAREAAEQLRTLMNDTPGGFARMRMHPDGTGCTEYANDGFCEMLGMTRYEVYNTYRNDLMTGVHPDDLADVSAAVKQAIATDGLLHMQYRLRAKSGEYVWMQIFSRFVPAENGDIIVNCYYADLSASEKQALNLRETLPFILSAIMDSSPDLAFAKDKDFRYICCSPGFVKFTRQKTEADVIGKDDYDLWTKEEADHFRGDDVRLFEGGESLIDFIEPIPSDDGIQHYSITSKYILRDSAGEIVGLYGLGRDITDTRAALDRLQLLTDSIPGGIATYAVSPDSIKITYFNDGFCKIFGCTREEYEALTAEKGVISLVYPEDLPAIMAQQTALLADGAPIDCTYRARRFDGSGCIWLNLRGVLVERHDDTVFINTVLYDVTAQREAEQEIESAAVQIRNMTDDMPGGFIRLHIAADGSQKPVYINDGFTKLLGLTREEAMVLCSGDMRMRVHPDDVDTVIEANAAIAGMMETGETRRTRYRLRRGDGSYIWLSVLGRITRDASGDTYLNVYYTDATEQAGDETFHQQTLPLLLSTIMEASNDYAFAKDRDFRYICCSPAFLHLAGLTNEQAVIGKTDYELFPANMAEQFRQNDLALLESGKPLVDFDETVYAQDGTLHFCLASKHILRDAAGASIGIYGVSRDITKEHSVLEQLQLVNDSLPGGIATYACQDNAALRIVYCNDGFCKLFGGTREGLEKRGGFDPLDWVFEADRAGLLAQIHALVQDNAPMDCIFRIHVLGGGYKWINEKAIAAERHGDTVQFNAILFDVTERQNVNEQLRISEEENSLAIQHGGNIVCRYDVAEKSLTISPGVAAAYSIAEKITDVPEGPVREGMISPESADAYIGFFEAIQRGSKVGAVLYQQRYFGDWRWIEAKGSTIFSDNGKPVKAVISLFDVTERLEKETIYKKWQHSLEDRVPESYTLFRCNLNRNTTYETREGTLFTFDIDDAGRSFNERADVYANQCIYEEDRDKYIAFVNSDTMLASYYRGKRSDTLEYRELLHHDGVYRWRRLSIDLVEYPNSTDVEAYLMYEDIDEAKKAELATKALSETDPLTGLLNRSAFTAAVNSILAVAKPETRHALLMLDIDGFKRVNDVFGHGAGDQALIETAEKLRSIMRHDDLVARLGGDEFVVFINGITDADAAIAKSKQIRSLVRKSFSMEVQISASIGIAFAPRDGRDFGTLYKKADAALYHVKGSGKDNQAVYRDNMADEHLEPEPDVLDHTGRKVKDKKRRMLIVDDNSIDYAMLQNIFHDEFIIEKARDGNAALIRMRHYGSAISVVLLDLMMPGMDGFAVLEAMQESAELRAIPVIIVSGDESREACLNAIRRGATDFVTKPVDAELLRIRVRSAVSKAENERLRAKNSLLEVLNDERLRYDSILESAGIAFLWLDWHTGACTYHASIAKYLFGVYDERPFWQVLLADASTDAETVQAMQQLVFRVAEGKSQGVASMQVKLMTPLREMHRFRVSVCRLANEYQPANRLIIALDDLEF